MTDFDSGPIFPVGGPTTYISIPLFVYPFKILKGVQITFPDYTGSFSFEITGNGRDAVPTWTSVTPSPNSVSTVTFSSAGDYMLFRIIGAPGTIINGGLTLKYIF